MLSVLQARTTCLQAPGRGGRRPPQPEPPLWLQTSAPGRGFEAPRAERDRRMPLPQDYDCAEANRTLKWKTPGAASVAERASSARGDARGPTPSKDLQEFLGHKARPRYTETITLTPRSPLLTKTCKGTDGNGRLIRLASLMLLPGQGQPLRRLPELRPIPHPADPAPSLQAHRSRAPFYEQP